MKTENEIVEQMIKRMVDRFLGWRLPEHFNPDAGISFVPEYNKEYMARLGKPPMRHEPIGTNLFDATQAEQMIRHILADEISALRQQDLARMARMREALDFLLRAHRITVSRTVPDTVYAAEAKLDCIRTAVKLAEEALSETSDIQEWMDGQRADAVNEANKGLLLNRADVPNPIGARSTKGEGKSDAGAQMLMPRLLPESPLPPNPVRIDDKCNKEKR